MTDLKNFLIKTTTNKNDNTAYIPKKYFVDGLSGATQFSYPVKGMCIFSTSKLKMFQTKSKISKGSFALKQMKAVLILKLPKKSLKPTNQSVL